MQKLAPVALIFGLLLAACAPASSGTPAASPLPAETQAVHTTQPEAPAGEGASPTAAGPGESGEAETATPLPAGYPAPEVTATAPLVAQPYPAPEAVENATAFPDPTQFQWVEVVNGLDKPLDLTGDRNGRLLVVLQNGRIVVLENGTLRDEPYLDIADKITTAGNEQGLLGIALHPLYQDNGYFYVNYSRKQDGGTVIARFTADPQTAVADPASEKILLEVAQPYQNHNGGGLHFGPDGYLYIGLGDGGSGGDPQNNAQNPEMLLGKMLRIDVDGGDPYAIPADNPYAEMGGKAEIWGIGLRNPFRFSFDRLTGDLVIADVGQNKWEEVHFVPFGSSPGINFGWKFFEGTHPFEGEPPQGVSFDVPIFEYSHPTGCSITGGYVYRGSELPEFQGIYLVGDYCSGLIWGLMRGADGQWQNKELFQSGAMISSFGEDDQGELYLLNHAGGSVQRLARR